MQCEDIAFQMMLLLEGQLRWQKPLDPKKQKHAIHMLKSLLKTWDKQMQVYVNIISYQKSQSIIKEVKIKSYYYKKEGEVQAEKVKEYRVVDLK